MAVCYKNFSTNNHEDDRPLAKRTVRYFCFLPSFALCLCIFVFFFVSVYFCLCVSVVLSLFLCSPFSSPPFSSWEESSSFPLPVLPCSVARARTLPSALSVKPVLFRMMRVLEVFRVSRILRVLRVLRVLTECWQCWRGRGSEVLQAWERRLHRERLLLSAKSSP